MMNRRNLLAGAAAVLAAPTAAQANLLAEPSFVGYYESLWKVSIFFLDVDIDNTLRTLRIAAPTRERALASVDEWKEWAASHGGIAWIIEPPARG